MQTVQQVTVARQRAEEPEASAGKETKIAVVIPTMNEPAVGKVIGEARQSLKGYALEVVVVDKSVDDTPEKATEAGARVIAQERSGYGDAYVLGFGHVPPDTKVVVTIDGDYTYDPREISLLIDPILRGDADLVLGNRFAHMDRGAMALRNRFGNRVITGTINLLFGLRLKDSQTGFRALRAGALRQLELESDGMPFASEMIIDAHRKGLHIAEVPVSYRRRIGQAKMKAYRDGSLIIGLVLLMAQRYNPLTIFLPIGLLTMLGGIVLWAIVIQEWLSTGTINRLASVAGGTLLFLTGVQIIIFGVLTSIIISVRSGR